MGTGEWASMMGNVWGELAAGRYDAVAAVCQPFRAPPQFGKLAVDGEWERAVTFQPGEYTEEAQAAEFLAGGSEVACEAFFGAAFFGVRRRGATGELSRFVALFARAVASSGDGAELLRAMATARVPLGRDFRFAEIGAEGAWNSVGPFRLDDPAAALADFDATWLALEHSNVGREAAHHKAVEFSFDNGDGTTHWFALPVSHARRLDRTRLAEALAAGTAVARHDGGDAFIGRRHPSDS